MSEGVEWAAHCLLLLCALPDDATLPAGRLAEYHGIPAPYLAKSLQALAGAGIVSSVPGRHGGYRLSRSPSEITLLDVVLAVEGDEAFFRCTEIRKRGPSRVAARAYPSMCGIAAAMDRAETAWRAQLEQTTIAQLSGGVLRGAPPAALAKTADWLRQTLPGKLRSGDGKGEHS